VTRNTPIVDNLDGTAKKVKTELQQSSDAATYIEFTESFGGPECSNVWRAPFKLIGLTESEDE